MYRELKHVHPSFSLSELNREALSWCREEYGMAKHGTTGIEPAVAFENEEKGLLKYLPAVRFEVPKWKQVKVAPTSSLRLTVNAMRCRMHSGVDGSVVAKQACCCVFLTIKTCLSGNM